MVISKRRSLLFFSLAALATAIVAVNCQSCATPEPEPRAVVLADVDDVAAGRIRAEALLGALPTSFLVVNAAEIENGMALRARLMAAHPKATFATVVDASGLDDLKATALSDGLLEAALEEGHPVLLDRAGACARDLRDGARSTQIVRVGADRRVAAVLVLPGPPEAEGAALGIAPAKS